MILMRFPLVSDDFWYQVLIRHLLVSRTGGVFSGPITAQADLKAIAGDENVPGKTTKGFDHFNIHLHGLEVAPHLFHPMGTSTPDSHFIELKPDTPAEQCYCIAHTPPSENL